MNSINEQYADPTLDWSFKKIFLSPGHEETLRAFLNDVLQGDLDVQQVDSIKGIEQEHAKGKKIIYDIHCKSKAGEHFIIEIQRKEEQHFFKRLEYYRCRAFTGQIQTAEKYWKALPVIVIAVCDFPILDKLFPDSPGMYFEKIRYQGVSSKSPLSGPPHFIFLDLPAYQSQGFPKNSMLEDWFQLFTCKALPDGPSVTRTEVKEALKGLIIDNMSLEDREEMEVEALQKQIALSVLETAVEKAVEKSKLEVAKNMLKKGCDPENVVEYLGMALTDVLAIKETME